MHHLPHLAVIALCLTVAPLHARATQQLQYTSADAVYTFEPALHGVTIETTVTLVALAEVDHLTIQLDPLAEQSVTIADAQGVLPHTGSVLLEVDLRSPVGAGSTFELYLTQTGVVPAITGAPTELLLAQVNEQQIFNLMGGWQFMVQQAGPGFAQVVTYALTLPADLSVAAAGLLTAEVDHGDGSVTHHFSGRRDQGLVALSFFAGPLITGKSPLGAGSVQTYLSKENAPHGEAWRQLAAEIWNDHQERLGPLGFEKIDIAEYPDDLIRACGTVGQGVVYITSSFFSGKPPAPATIVVLAHELAHFWFGGAIDIIQYCAPWLGEGFATFIERQYVIPLREAELGPGAGPLLRRKAINRYVYGVRAGDSPLTSCDTVLNKPELLVPVTYAKGSLVVGLLYYLLGEETFYRALRRYKEDHRGVGANTDSFFASLEAATGRDFSEFSQRWVYEAGYPTLIVEVRQTDSTGRQGVVEITADRDPVVPIELDLVTADGTHRRRVTLKDGQASLTFDHAAALIEVVVDPERWIPARTQGAQTGDIRLDGAVDGVDLILAASAVGRGHHPPPQQCLPDWTLELIPEQADLVFDGVIDDQDLAVVLDAFGKQRAGE